MKRTILLLIIFIIFSNIVFSQSKINIHSNYLIKYDVLLEDDISLRNEFNKFNKMLVKDGIFEKPIEVAYIGYHKPKDFNPAVGVCYNTEFGNIIIIMKDKNEHWSEDMFIRVLIHEMIHAYQCQVLNDPSLEHNDNFKKITKQINLKYHYNIQNN